MRFNLKQDKKSGINYSVQIRQKCQKDIKLHLLFILAKDRK